MENNETIPIENHETIPVENNETIPVENNENIPAESNETIQAKNDEIIPAENNQTIHVEKNETIPVENNETIPVENNETIPAENNETIPVAKEPLPSSHGSFKLSDLFQKILESIQRTFIEINILLKGDNQRETTPAENNESIPFENNETILAENNETIPVDNNEPIPANNNATMPAENNENIPDEKEPLPSSHDYFKLSDLFQNLLESIQRTFHKLVFLLKETINRRLSLPRTMKPSLLRRSRLPAVMGISNFQNFFQQILESTLRTFNKLVSC